MKKLLSILLSATFVASLMLSGCANTPKAPDAGSENANYGREDTESYAEEVTEGIINENFKMPEFNEVTSECDECGGTGQVMCTWCNGTGVMFPDTDYSYACRCGDGYSDCIPCNATGTVTRYVDENGLPITADEYYDRWNIFYQEYLKRLEDQGYNTDGYAGSFDTDAIGSDGSDAYGGIGNNDCPICNGHGKKTCDSCGGDGVLFTKQRDAIDLDGNGGAAYGHDQRCHACRGSGQVHCIACGGTGKI